MNKTILIVEDDAVTAMAEEHFLSKAGFTVLTAGSGEEAVGFVLSEKNLVDLILMDIDLGKGIDGAQAARSILADQDIPVIFISSHLEREITEKIEAIPSYGFVIKNSGDDVMLASIKMAFSLHDAHQALKQAAEVERNLRQSQERFRLLFNATHEAVFIHRFDEEWVPGVFIEVNDTACTRYGYTRAEFMQMSPLDIDTPENVEALPRIMAKLKTEGSAVWEGTHRTKSGEIFPVEISNVVFPMDGVPMILASVRTITERKKTEELEHQLIQAQKLEGIGTLAGGIAHDFNNLLAMILGSAELLRNHIGDQPQLKRYVDRIIEASERGASISRQLLIFSKPDGVEFAQISLPHIVTELSDMLGHFMSKSISIDASINVEDGMILGDLGQIHQALLNIALNAGDAMPDGGRLLIHARFASLDEVRRKFPLADIPSYIAVSVTDTGRGMKDEIRKKIFDPFFTTKDRGKGTGLGLAIVHGIVKNHRGFIDVESTPGIGTTFTLYFPGLARQTDPSAAEPAGEPARPPRGTILIVDDEMVIREALQECLEDLGYDVLAAANGKDALLRYQEHRETIVLVITDMGMPGMSGDELFRQLVSVDESVKVLISSGYFEEAMEVKLMSMGVKKLLAKPYKTAELQDAIQSLLAPPDAAQSVQSSSMSESTQTLKSNR